ncbi:MAG: hypothetical protein Q8P25_02260 [Candidatus Curtissbacteria bacterium]|nr:hypothetical protein [Candidatus Curtissbacteria bacterium]
MNVERKSWGEKIAEFSKKLDIFQFAIGGAIYIVNPTVGGVILVGSAITYFVADEYQRRQKSKRRLGMA